MSRLLLALTCSLLCAACIGVPSGLADAGPGDAGQTTGDAGQPQDAGQTADAGAPADAGLTSDGGPSWDGGLGEDLGPGPVYYVDGSATGCGGAPCSDSNAGTSEATAFATPTACLAHLAGGDTCVIKNGTYAHPGTGYTGSFPIAAGGTATGFTTFMAFPGHQPRLCVDAACTAGHPWPTISVTSPYVRVSGLAVVGVISVLTTHHVRVDHNDVTGGQDCDGNFNLVRLDYSHHLRVDHNTLHGLDTSRCADPPRQTSAAGIKNFCSVDSVYENNTIEGGGGMVIGIDDKDTSIRNVARFNLITGASVTPIREEAQSNTATHPECLMWGSARDTQLYGNVLVTTALEGIRVDDPVATLSIHHNTISTGVPFFWNDAAMTGHVVRDNLLFSVGSSDVGALFNLVFMPTASLPSLTIDSNVYDPAAAFNLNGFYSGQGGITSTTLADWRTSLSQHGCVNCEVNSHAQSCGVLAPPDYRLPPGSPCATFSSTGGEVGAFGVTNCVGASCP